MLLAPDYRAEIASHALEQAAVGDHAVLDHFVQTGPEVAPGERAEHFRIREYGQRLMERANQVLAERMIDADLAADGAVDLRKQRGRDVHEPDAAQIGGRGESDDVADHAAADRDDGDAAVGRHANQCVVDPADGLQGLGTLAVGHQDVLHVP